MVKEIEVFAIRFKNSKLKAVVSEMNDIVTAEKMKSYIKVDGMNFFTNLNGEKVVFKFDTEGELTSPDPKQLELIKVF